MKYNFTFEAGEVNLILQALQELPHKTVSGLVSAIVTSSRSQEAASKLAEEAAKSAALAEAAKAAAEESKAV